MQGVSDIYAQMQQELFDNMIKRLIVRGSADLQENPYIWQMQKLNDMHMLNEENLKIITERTGIAEDLLRDVIANEGLKVYKDTKQQLAEDLGRRDGEYIANGVTDSLEAYTSQAISDLNLINTTLPRSIQKTYKSIVEKSVAEVVISSKSADKAIRDTIMKWQKKNFTGFVDKGGREWRADAYARAIIKTTTFRVYNEMRTAPAKEMGIDTYYYSKKATAREMCAPLQGRIVTMEGMTHTEQGVKALALSDYGYGYAGGCLGVHCGHYLTPFIIGVNELPEDPDYLKDLTPEQAEENARIQAKQRALERAIRNQKERLHIASQLGDDELITSERLKLRNLQGKMRAYVDQHDFLHRDYSRERLFSTQNSYEKNKILLGTKKKTLEKQREVKSAIIGMKTSNNIKIKDVSKHLVDRAVERKVETQTIIDALKNPLEIKEIKYDEYGRPSQKFIGKDTSVVINPSTGNIATTHKTGKRIRRKYGFEK
jgi:hypothetical protein